MNTGGAGGEEEEPIRLRAAAHVQGAESVRLRRLQFAQDGGRVDLDHLVGGANLVETGRVSPRDGHVGGGGGNAKQRRQGVMADTRVPFARVAGFVEGVNYRKQKAIATIESPEYRAAQKLLAGAVEREVRIVEGV